MSIALMKSQIPWAVVTQISCAPIPFIGGMALFGSRFFTRPMLAVISSAVALEHCALAGMGVALLAEWLVGEDMRAGRLVQVLSTYDVTPASGNFDTAIWFVYPSREHVPLKVRVFSDFVRDAFRVKTASA